jgi:VIT1/CCC1 family predicted Fe2+/Mn2+ transporter
MSTSAPAHRREAATPAEVDHEPSLGELITSAQRDFSQLVKQEIELLKSELRVSAKVGGVSMGLFAAAGFIALLAVVLLSFFFVYLVHLTGLDLVWSYLVVVVVYLVVAAILGYVGSRKVRKVRPPQRAIAQAQETKETLLNRG